MKAKHPRRSGFTLLEVAIAIILILLVGTTAAASIRMGLRTLTGSELSALATSAVRELREVTFSTDLETLDQMNGSDWTPVLGDGKSMPGMENLIIKIEIIPVDDQDPATVVAPEDSSSRIVSTTTYSAGRKILEARWLTTEH